MPIPTIDERQWPLIFVDWAGPVSLEEIDAHFDQMTALMGRGQRFAVVMDIQQVLAMPAEQRKRTAARLKELAPKGERTVICNAHIVRSSLAKGMLSAIYWIAPPPFPTKVFTDRAEAEAWARERMAADTAVPAT